MRILVLAVLLVLAHRALAASADRRLASGGRSRVTVVLSTAPGPLTQAAAADLARCLSKALGAPVSLAREGETVATPLAIVAGATDGVDLASVTRDGCVLRTVGDRLLIGGVADSGISNGVYTYLQDHVGARWLTPAPLFELVPKRPDLALPQLDYRHNPDFGYRVYSGVTGPGASDYTRRNRIETSWREMPRFGFGHNVHAIYPPSRYAKEHPEYYALIDGKRRLPRDDDDWGVANPCFTHPDVIRIAAETADRWFRADPTRTTFSLCINDTGAFCHCPNCQKLDAGAPKSQGGAETCSDSYFHFMTEVAKRVAVTNPGKSLGCYAYWCVEPVPRYIDRLPDNVVVQLTQDSSQYHDKAYRDRDRAFWTAWSKKARYLGQYDYYGLGWVLPRYYPRLAAENLRFVRPTADGLYCEVYPNWPVTAPQLLVAARMLWDVRTSPDATLDETMRLAFGAGAPAITRFYRTLETYWKRPRKGRWFEGLGDMRAEQVIADAALMEEAYDCLKEAETISQGDDRARVSYIKSHMRMPYIVVRTNAAIRRIAARPITSVADLDAIAEDARVALRAVPQARTEYATYWQTDPNLNETYYGPDPMLKKLNFWALDLGRWMHVVARRAHQFCREASPAGSSEEAWAAFRTKLLAIPYVDLAPHVETVERTSVCPVAPREIRVDGDLADWDGVPELAMERLRGWDRPPTPAAQTGRFRMAWDPRGLLIAAEIEGTGPALVAGDAEPPRGQGLRIAVNPHPEDLRQVDPAPHVTEIALCPRETGPVVWRLQAPGSKGPGVMAGVPFVARRFGNRTVYEALVPWKALGIARPAAGQVIGFAIAASDAWPMADSAYLGWGRGIQFAHDQRLYYPVTLGGEGGR